MRNIKITVEYDGANYAGWQRQPKRPAIQQRLEEAISKVTGAERVVVHGSGRTDAGVHAVGQVANFHTRSAVPVASFPPAINSHLPPDIAVIDAEEVSESFHARKSARSKWYRYTIVRRRYRAAVGRQYALCVTNSLDVEAMREAAGHLVGRHDFSAFESKRTGGKNSVRTITTLDVTEEGDKIIIDVRADGFLYNMVRAIVGTLLEVGRGKIERCEVRSILRSKRRALAGYTVAARGLCLMEVNY